MSFWTNPNKRMTVSASDGTLQIFGDFVADAATDLADTIDDQDIAPGSLALVIETGDFYAMGSDGNWANVSNPPADSRNGGDAKNGGDDLKKVVVEEPEEEEIEEPEEPKKEER